MNRMHLVLASTTPARRTRVGGTCVAALVDEVIHQARMAAHRRAQPCGTEVRFRRDRILPVAQVIRDVGQNLGEGDSLIGRRARVPLGHERAHAIEHESAKARVVLGQIVDVERSALWHGAGTFGATVEVRRTLCLEGEFESRQPWVEVRRRLRVLGVLHQAQLI